MFESCNQGGMMRGERLRKRREDLGLSQAELGERLGIEGRAIYRYEKNQVDPSADTLAKLSQELRVTADYLLGLVDEPSEHLTEEALTPAERKLLAAFRRFDLETLMRTALESSKPNPDDEAPSST
jgi:transcriptional regulator with XRE-family HTH domain